MADTPDTTRALIAVHGEEAVHFLQGILTQDVTKLSDEKIQFASLLSPQGKILHDMFLISGPAVGAEVDILIDTPAIHAPLLLKRLAIYKLRAKVTITDVSNAWHVAYSEQNGLADPRHPRLMKRHYTVETLPHDDAKLAHLHNMERALGIPNSAVDFAPDSIVAMDAGYDLLHAISFTKGCYVGQEVTARMHYKHIARKAFYVLESEHAPMRLALLKFDEVDAANGTITLDNVAYRAYLPEWMQPKYQQSRSQAAE